MITRLLNRFVAVAMVSLALPAAAHAALTVDQDPSICSDARTASQVSAATPWCSLQAGATKAPDGSTVEVRGGSYPYAQLRGNFTGLPSVARQDYVTFKPYASESVTVAGVNTANIDHLRFDNFNFVGSDILGVRPAFWVYSNSQHIEIINSDLSGQGIGVQSANHLRFEGNFIHAIGRNCSAGTPDGFGLYATRVDDMQVINNIIAGSKQDGINVGAATNVLIEGNDVSPVPQAQALCGDHVDNMQTENGGTGPIFVRYNHFDQGGQFILRNTTGLVIDSNLIENMTGYMQLEADPGAIIRSNVWWKGNGCPDGIHNCLAGSLLLRDYLPGSNETKPPFNYTNHMDGTIVEGNVLRSFGVDKVPQAAYAEDGNFLYGPPAASSGLVGEHDFFFSIG